MSLSYLILSTIFSIFKTISDALPSKNRPIPPMNKVSPVKEQLLELNILIVFPSTVLYSSVISSSSI